MKSFTKRMIFFVPTIVKYNEKEPRYNKTSIVIAKFARPLALRYIEVPLYRSIIIIFIA